MWLVSCINKIYYSISKSDPCTKNMLLKKDLVRPTRIAVRRANELHCVIQYAEDVKDAEWQNEAEMNIIELIERAPGDTVSIILIDNMDKWIKQTWSSE